MIKEKETRNKQRIKRAMRVRRKLRGHYPKPRLSVFKSNKHLSVQIIDDEQGITVAGFGTYAKELKGKKGSKEVAKVIGTKIAELAKAKGVLSVVFDRGNLKYHGIIAEVANGAREAGLKL